MSLEHILLGLLKEPASGYDLKHAFEESIRHFWSTDMAQIYRTLQRMESVGLLRSKEQASEKGPSRRVYRRTAAGRKRLLAWLRSEPQIGAERFAYIGQLVFMHELEDPNATIGFLSQLRGRLQALLSFFQQMEADESESGMEGMSDEDFHGYLGLRMGISSLTAKIQWCDESIELTKDRLPKNI